MKRKREEKDISDAFLQSCEKKFKDDPMNNIIKNAVNSVGSFLTTMNSDQINQVSHVFLNSIKKKNVKACNQGASGRCWMFAGLNIFRNILMKVLDLDSFEFSEVYLFFWDKLERANTYITWFIEHPEEQPGHRAFDYMVENYMGDGGFWNYFTNLIQKYGLVPVSSMKETFQSEDSEDMNRILKEQLDSCVNQICVIGSKAQEKIRKDTLQNVYNTLVKFLGQPPKSFDWFFSREDNDPGIITGLTPKLFLETVAPDINFDEDFIILTHSPTRDLELYRNYTVKYTKNTVEGKDCTFFTLPVNEMAKYVTKSIEGGLGVWFSGDVSKSFNFYQSALDDRLDDHKTVFPLEYKFEKGDRITMRNVQANHGMMFTGFNVDENNKITNFQVENSWGYNDNHTPGQDGFLTMSYSWFEKYVIQVVIHRKFLSRTVLKKLRGDAETLEPWSAMAPALRCGGKGVPDKYRIWKNTVKYRNSNF